VVIVYYRRASRTMLIAKSTFPSARAACSNAVVPQRRRPWSPTFNSTLKFQASSLPSRPSRTTLHVELAPSRTRRTRLLIKSRTIAYSLFSFFFFPQREQNPLSRCPGRSRSSDNFIAEHSEDARNVILLERLHRLCLVNVPTRTKNLNVRFSSRPAANGRPSPQVFSVAVYSLTARIVNFRLRSGWLAVARGDSEFARGS